jgi:hypothetical protein
MAASFNGIFLCGSRFGTSRIGRACASQGSQDFVKGRWHFVPAARSIHFLLVESKIVALSVRYITYGPAGWATKALRLRHKLGQFYDLLYSVDIYDSYRAGRRMV